VNYLKWVPRMLEFSTIYYSKSVHYNLGVWCMTPLFELTCNLSIKNMNGTMKIPQMSTSHYCYIKQIVLPLYRHLYNNKSIRCITYLSKMYINDVSYYFNFIGYVTITFIKQLSTILPVIHIMLKRVFKFCK